MLFPESGCGKGVTCCGAEESPLPCFTLTFCAEITHTSAPQACEAWKDPTSPISHHWLLPFKNLHRRCTGLTPTTKEILSFSIVILHQSHTVNSKHLHTPAKLKWLNSFLPEQGWPVVTKNGLVEEVAVGRAESSTQVLLFSPPDRTNVRSHDLWPKARTHIH